MIRKKFIYILLAIILILGGFFFFFIMTAFNPDEILSLNINNNQVNLIEAKETITLMTYNIGYGGLNSRWDSYHDGGRKTRAESKNQVEENLEEMVKKIDDINPDIFLLQEIDTDSNRSYHINQLEFFGEKYPNYSYIYARVKDHSWLPFPITKPVGKVQSGLATFSKYNTFESYRISLPTTDSIISNIFESKWAITKTIYETDLDGDLLVINVKLSPYNEGDFIREEQLHFLKSLLEEEYNKGNYVVVGGDYSHDLPGADSHSFRYTEEWPAWLKNIPDDYEIENYSWYIDKKTPSFRSLADAYDMGRTFVAVTDGFLVSDNILVQEVETHDDNFQNSNHNPVSIQLKLIP